MCTRRLVIITTNVKYLLRLDFSKSALIRLESSYWHDYMKHIHFNQALVVISCIRVNSFFIVSIAGEGNGCLECWQKSQWARSILTFDNVEHVFFYNLTLYIILTNLIFLIHVIVQVKYINSIYSLRKSQIINWGLCKVCFIPFPAGSRDWYHNTFIVLRYCPSLKSRQHAEWVKRYFPLQIIRYWK